MVKQLILCLALLCSPAWASWACLDGGTGCTSTTVRSCSVTGTSCNITVASTTAGALLVLCEKVSTNAITLTGSGAGTWTTSVPTHSSSGTTLGGECAYNTSATGGVTTITCTFSASAGNDCQFFSFSGTSITFDSGNSAADAACTTCAGVAPTLSTAKNYLFIQSVAATNQITAIDQSYVIAIDANNNGLAYKLNQSVAGTTPNWTQNVSGAADVAVLSFYENTASTCTPTLTLMGVGRCG